MANAEVPSPNPLSEHKKIIYRFVEFKTPIDPKTNRQIPIDDKLGAFLVGLYTVYAYTEAYKDAKWVEYFQKASKDDSGNIERIPSSKHIQEIMSSINDIGEISDVEEKKSEQTAITNIYQAASAALSQLTPDSTIVHISRDMIDKLRPLAVAMHHNIVTPISLPIGGSTIESPQIAESYATTDQQDITEGLNEVNGILADYFTILSGEYPKQDVTADWLLKRINKQTSGVSLKVAKDSLTEEQLKKIHLQISPRIFGQLVGNLSRNWSDAADDAAKKPWRKILRDDNEVKVRITKQKKSKLEPRKQRLVIEVTDNLTGMDRRLLKKDRYGRHYKPGVGVEKNEDQTGGSRVGMSFQEEYMRKGYRMSTKLENIVVYDKHKKKLSNGAKQIFSFPIEDKR